MEKLPSFFSSTFVKTCGEKLAFEFQHFAETFYYLDFQSQATFHFQNKPGCVCVDVTGNTACLMVLSV